jgi:hypothetical protein
MSTTEIIGIIVAVASFIAIMLAISPLGSQVKDLDTGRRHRSHKPAPPEDAAAACNLPPRSRMDAAPMSLGLRRQDRSWLDEGDDSQRGVVIGRVHGTQMVMCSESYRGVPELPGDASTGNDCPAWLWRLRAPAVEVPGGSEDYHET